jgi:selenocysteine-specific elongation factor
LEVKQPLELQGVVSVSELPAGQVNQALDNLIKEARVVVIGQGDARLFYTDTGWMRLIKDISAVLQEYHRKYPVRLGMPKVELASRLKMGKQSPLILQRLAEQGVFKDEGLNVRLISHEVHLSTSQQMVVDAFLKSLAQNPYAPPSDLIPEPDLLNLLIERRQVIKTGEVVFSTKAYDDMVAGITAYIKSHGKITLAESRDLFKTSRRYVQSLLEYLDEKKITRRIGDDRVLY